MDKSNLIGEFAKLRVLTPFDFQRMDELVKDLTNALEESSSSNVVTVALKQQHQKRRGGRKRRPIKLNTCTLTTATTSLGGGGGTSSSTVGQHKSSSSQIVLSPSSTKQTSLHLLACSEDSVSSIDAEDTGIIVAKNANVGKFGTGRHSDSDCCQVSGGGNRTRPIVVGRSSIPQTTQQKPFFAVGSFAESDSVNENFSPVRPHRRKRKFKRMAVDPSVSLGSDPSNVGLIAMQRGGSKSESGWSLRRGELLDGHGYLEVDALRSPILPGKRKHSARERSLELPEGEMALRLAGKNLGSMVISEVSSEPCEEPSTGGEGTMDLSEEGVAYEITESSSSCLSSSSSESDAGIYTNDEGREGDDEHSDFYHEGGPSCGIPGVLPWWENARPLEMDEDDRVAEDTFQSLLAGSFPHLSSYEGQQHSFGSGVCQLPQMHGREIRAGRRRLRDLRPGFSIVSSMNEKISKFLQDTEQNELRLQPMRKKEMDQLGHLASLYSLNMRSDGSNEDKCPVLTKTRNTTQVVNLDKIGVTTLWSRTVVNDIKRRRRTPPRSPGNEDLPGEISSDPMIPDQNQGNPILRNMSWESGTDRDGIKPPVMTHLRHRHHGQNCARPNDL